MSHAPSTGIPPVKPGGKCGYRMQQVIETHLPHLSRPQLTGLVLWVCGAILAGSACQNAVASALSPWGAWNNFRQYLREWLYDGSDRARPCQTELDVSLCFAPLLRWVLAWWRSGRLALAVDPTLKGDQTTAIVISVVYRGCAIPVAWRIHRATQRGSWMDPTVELLRKLAPAVPKEMTVIVLCDRGIASPKLWRQIRAQGWHPYMRYRKNVSFCAQDGRRLPAQHFVSRPDTAWIGRGTAFSTPNAKRRCTLLAVWYVEQEEPWIIPDPGLSSQLHPNPTPAAPGNLYAPPRGTSSATCTPRTPALPCPSARGGDKPAGPGGGATMQTNSANGHHQHEVSEKRLAPGTFPCRTDMETCACGARRWVDQNGAPPHPVAVHQPGNQETCGK